MILGILAAVFTFTATATGVEKGTPLEFMFAGKDTDRDYETMFLLDGTVEAFWEGIEKAGIPRGVPMDTVRCRLWPVGVPLTLEPAMNEFVETDLPDGLTLGEIIYTGGTRNKKGSTVASEEMPAAVFALYSLSQSLLLPNGVFEQGVVYGAHKAKLTLKKGERKTFRLTWDGQTRPRPLSVEFKPGNAKAVLSEIRLTAEKGEVDLEVGFSSDLTVEEATAAAQALSMLDSVRVKVNGRREGDFFFRAFLPLVKWKDRKERLTQPFEITIGSPDRIVFIEEDWTVEGDDPRLTEKSISYEQMHEHSKTDTAFFYAKRDTKLGILKASLAKVPKSVINHYVYWE